MMQFGVGHPLPKICHHSHRHKLLISQGFNPCWLGNRAYRFSPRMHWRFLAKPIIAWHRCKPAAAPSEPGSSSRLSTYQASLLALARLGPVDSPSAVHAKVRRLRYCAMLQSVENRFSSLRIFTPSAQCCTKPSASAAPKTCRCLISSAAVHSIPCEFYRVTPCFGPGWRS